MAGNAGAGGETNLAGRALEAVIQLFGHRVVFFLASEPVD